MYSSGKYQIVLKQAADLNTLADIGNWAPLVPTKISMIGAMIGNDIAAAGVIKFDKRPTFGSDTNRGDGDIGVLNLTTAHTGGKVVYKELANMWVYPGQQVVAEVTDVTGASDTADVMLWVEPVWENPVNRAAMVLST